MAKASCLEKTTPPESMTSFLFATSYELKFESEYGRKKMFDSVWEKTTGSKFLTY